MTKTMTNAEIYGLSKALNSAFNNEEKYLPAKVNFYIQKNKNVVAQLSDIIEQSRLDVIKHYGVWQETDSSYLVPSEKVEEANRELTTLLNITQEVNIAMIHLSDLDGLEFTSAQMQALLFMIEED